LNFFFFFDWL